MGHTRRLQRALFLAAMAATPAASYSADISSTWFGGISTWNTAANWTNSPVVIQYPNNGNGGLTYDATVTAGTATQGSNLTIEALTFSGGSIDGAGFSLNINQAFNWTGGNLSGSGSVIANGGINISGSTGKSMQRSITSTGTTTWTGTTGVFGGGTFNNSVGATFNAEGTGGAFGIPLFNNSGTVFKFMPSTATNFGGALTFNNTGTMEVVAGTMNINGPVTQVTAGGTVMNGGTWNVSGTLNMSGIGGGGITTLGSGASVTLSTLGSVFTKIDSLTTNQGNFTITGGRFFTTVGPFSNTGTLTVGASSGLTVTTSLAEQPGSTLTAGTYVVSGTLVLPGAPITTNQANFTFDGASSTCTNFNAIADNQGTFTLSGGRSFGPAGVFNNSGTVHVAASSALTLASGGTHTGSFVLDSGGAMSLIANTHTFNSPATLSGAGTLNINGTSIVTGNANLTGPAITNWNGGTIGGGGGSLNIPSTATLRLSGSSGKSLQGVINNSGLTQWMGNSGVSGGGTFNNLLGANFLVLSGSTNAFGVSQFNNSGTIIKANSLVNNFGGVMTFNNTGTLDVQNGTFNINGAISQISAGTLTAGTWNVSGTATTLTLSTAGSITTIGPAATVALSGSGSSFSSINSLANNQGSFTVTNGRTFVTAGALVNSGALAIGPTALLRASGIVTNTGTLSIDVAGKLDLTNQKLITNTAVGTQSSGTYDGVQGQVQSGLNGGDWLGNGIITNQSDALTGLTTIGTSTGALARFLGPTDTDTWAGQTINGNSTLVMYTYAGDADLNGFIDGNDYGYIDFGVAVPGADGYGNGDFNYDGIIDGNDYGTIDFNILAQGAPFFASGDIGGGGSDLLTGVTSVPEPSGLIPIVLGAELLLYHRRRRFGGAGYRSPALHNASFGTGGV